MKKLLVIVAATVLSFSSVAALAPAPSADAALLYECRKYTWLTGWQKVITTNYTFYQNRGFTCYCIGTT